MLADDGALAEHGSDVLLRSIATTSTSGDGTRADLQPGASGLITGIRLQRLLTRPRPLAWPASVNLLAVSALLLVGPTTLILVS